MFNPLGFASTSVLQAPTSDGCSCVCAGWDCTSVVVITVMVYVDIEIALNLS